jgi:hypothetical protein
MHRYALRDDQWDKIKDFLPGRLARIGSGPILRHQSRSHHSLLVPEANKVAPSRQRASSLPSNVSPCIPLQRSMNSRSSLDIPTPTSSAIPCSGFP